MTSDSWGPRPGPLNPSYRVYAAESLSEAAASMEKERYYENHTRHQCAAEIKRRYFALMEWKETKREARKAWEESLST